MLSVNKYVIILIIVIHVFHFWTWYFFEHMFIYTWRRYTHDKVQLHQCRYRVRVSSPFVINIDPEHNVH